MFENFNKRWQETEVETMKFFFYQAEKLLSDELNRSESITNRCFQIITVLASISLGIFVFCIKILSDNYISISKNYDTIFGIVIPLITLIIGIVYFINELTKVVQPRENYPLGSSPHLLMNTEFLNTKGENQHKQVLFSECKEYHRRILDVKKNNKERVEIVKRVFFYIKCFFAVFTILFFSFYVVMQFVF